MLMNFDIFVSKLKLQLHYYIHFWPNTGKKVCLISVATLLFFKNNDFGIK